MAAGGLWLAVRGLSCAFVPPPAGSNSAFAQTTRPTEECQRPIVAQNVRQVGEARAPESELLPAIAALFGGLGAASSSIALVAPGQELNVENFRPVCPTSDSLYGAGKGLADLLLGSEGQEYRPLAIEALLRVRLEICVLESFVYEAIVPFIQRKGLGWILPFRETLDTVIAGTVFAVALNFILFGTTKILAVLSIYHDFIIGAPLRLIGFGILPEKKPKEKPLIQINWPGQTPEDEMEKPELPPADPPPVPLAIFGNACKYYGVFAEALKNFLEGLDTFVGRYLAVASVAYVSFKWAHFRFFNDLIQF